MNPRAARVLAALIVAPASAAVFAVTTGWAVGHVPAATPKAVLTPAALGYPIANPKLVAEGERADRLENQRRSLRRQLKSLHAAQHATAAQRQQAAAAALASSYARSTSTPSSGGAPAAKPAAPPPPTQGNTGASGSRP